MMGDRQLIAETILEQSILQKTIIYQESTFSLKDYGTQIGQSKVLHMRGSH